MLENVLFFIHILKIAMIARRSVIIHQTSAFVILLCWHLTLLLSNFVGGDARFIFSPGARYPRYATDITLLVFESCTII